MPTEYLENLGTPSGLIATNVTGTASALTANSALTVVTNANLSGAITSVGNVTSLGSFTSAQLAAAITDETGTSKIVFSDSPQLAGIVNISNLTASTIISADASKNVVSLALATYPSLTELSYVKGVTSGIQAQIAAIPVNPSQTSKSEYVLSTDGSNSYWAIEGVKTGYPAGTVIVGGIKVAGLIGANNTVLGSDSFNGASLTTAYDNVVVGKGSAKLFTTAYNNFIAGNGAAPSATDPSNSVVIGKAAATSWLGGSSMVIIGASTACDSSAASGVAIGGSASIMGNQAVVVGSGAYCASAAVALGWSSWAASNSVGIGAQCVHKGTYGVMIGNLAGYGSSNSNGVGNVGVGYSALGSSTTNAGCVALGYKAGFYTTTQSNELFVDNQDRSTYANQQTKSLLYGTFNATASSQTLAINAAVSIPNNLSITTAGYGLKVKEGSNARMGVATLVGGTVTVSNTSVTANTRIMLTAQNNGGTIGFLSISARTAATSFVILSSSGSDTSDVAWMLVEPA